MHLKALEIQGFKSFPERTVIEFHEGVTAIIGPNGSGKSNVTDAIRWVLGEQSVKTLRGSRMEDVIFTGTQSRRAMSFAEVTMVIDNHDGQLPLEYSEIQITRRLYRSGESEYLLNKTVCRLRDIARLFMDTGLGRDGYSIVGQGRVDDILSHRSEDRRRIFEEASGIVKFKTRKEETERKLISTEQNLLRINDLIGELESRLAPLAAQAESARTCIEWRDTLKKLEVALILDTVDQHQEHLLEAERDKDVLLGDLAVANRALLDVRERNQRTSDEIHQLDTVILARQAEVGQISQAVHEQLNRNALIEERVSHLREQNQQAAQEEEELSGSLNDLAAELKIRQGKADQLKVQQKRYRQHLEEADQTLQQILLTLDSAEKAIEADKTRQDQLQEQLYNLRNECNQTRNQTSLVENRRKTIALEHRELVSDLDRLKIRREELDSLLADLAARQTQAQSAKDTAQSALDQARQACNQLNRQLEADRQNLHNRRFRLQTLSELERSHEGYQEAVKRLMQQSDQDQSFGRGIRGTVGSLLSTGKDYELAIETALGPAIQNIVTDDEATATRLIDYLKSNRAGRATFLPLASIQGRTVDSQTIRRIDGMAGYIGLASKLVESDPDLQPVIDFLLGRVIIAETIDHAILMARRIQYACRIVTLEGDVINPGGSMTGGYNRHQASGLLGRTREIESLQQSLTALEQTIKSREDAAAVAENQMQDQARTLSAAERDLLDLSHMLVREEARLAALAQEEDKVTARQQLLQAEDEQLASQDRRIAAETSRIEAAILAMEQESAQIRERIGHQEGANKAEQERRDDLRDQITEWRVSLQSIDESLQAAQEMISRIEQDQTGQQNRLLRRQRDQSENQQETERLLAEKAVLTSKIDDLKRQGSELADQVRQLGEKKLAMEAEQADFFDRLESATSQISSLQAEIGRVESRTARYETMLDETKNRLWEEYELTVDQSRNWRQTGLNRTEAARRVGALKNDIKALGPVNLAAIDEYASVQERFTFLSGQRDDIEAARHKLSGVINELTEAMKEQFIAHFRLINENFSQVFAELFGGGMAEVHLEDDQDVLSCGIEIKAQPPGKKLQNLLLLSGGERCLTAIALLFAILKLRPTPFCVLDEVEAALDDANVLRFTEYIRSYARASQFILVTHRKGTMEAADRLYGVTMQERGISRILSMQLNDEAS